MYAIWCCKQQYTQRKERDNTQKQKSFFVYCVFWWCSATDDWCNWCWGKMISCLQVNSCLNSVHWGSSCFTACRHRTLLSFISFPFILTDVTVRPCPPRKAVTQVSSDQVATRAGVDADTHFTLVGVWREKEEEEGMFPDILMWWTRFHLCCPW